MLTVSSVRNVICRSTHNSPASPKTDRSSANTTITGSSRLIASFKYYVIFMLSCTCYAFDTLENVFSRTAISRKAALVTIRRAHNISDGSQHWTGNRMISPPFFLQSALPYNISRSAIIVHINADAIS